jgi:hypothetical protein
MKSPLLHLLLLSLVSLSLTQSGNSCLDECNKVPGTSVMACTNSMETVNIPVRHDRCYFYCNVTLLHSGPCKCPSFCYPQYTLGICGNGKCNCNPGWKGRDCSLVSCPVNDCSKNGQCVHRQNSVIIVSVNPGILGSVVLPNLSS